MRAASSVIPILLAVAAAASVVSPLPNTVHPGIRERISLDGAWHVRYDPDNQLKGETVNQGEFAACLLPSGPAGPAQVPIPSTIEEDRPGYDGGVWYWRDFLVPSAWEGSRVVLEFDAVDYRCEVSVNGRRRGRTTNTGGYLPFSEDITDRVLFGQTNRLMVYVEDLPLAQPAEPGERRGFEIDRLPHGLQTTHGNFGGIWQSVELVRIAPFYLLDVRVETEVDPAELDVYYTYHVPSGWAGEVAAEFVLTPDDDWNAPVAAGRVELITDRDGVYPSKVTLHPAAVDLWTPESPRLYRLTVTLHVRAGVLDQKQVRFGFRRIGVADGRLTWNGQPLELRAAAYLPAHGRSLAPPLDPEVFKQDLRAARRAGLNAFLLLGTPLPPALLHAADEEGFLLLAEPDTAGMQPSRISKGLALKNVMELVLRDRNHPSILAWSRAAGDRALDTDAEKTILAARVRALDGERPIFDCSLAAPGAGRCFLPGSTDFVPLRVASPGAPREATDELLFLRVPPAAGIAGVAATLSRFGRRPGAQFEAESALRRITQDLLEQFEFAGLAETFGSLEGFLDLSAAAQADFLADNVFAARAADAAGLLVETWNDASWDLRGLVTQFRAPKPAYAAVAAALAPLALRITADPPVPVAGQRAELRVDCTSAADGPHRGELAVQVAAAPGGTLVLAERQRVAFGRGTAALCRGLFTPPAEAASLQVVARLQLEDGEILSATAAVPVLGPRAAVTGPLALLSDDPALATFLENEDLTPHRGLPAGIDRAVVVAGPFRGDRLPCEPELLPDLYDRVHRGDTAVMLGVPLLSQRTTYGWALAFAEAFPFALEAVIPEVAGALPTHFVRRHPATSGLDVPAGLRPGGPYGALLPQRLLAWWNPDRSATLLLPGETLVGWYAPLRGRSREWQEVGRGWAGSSVAELSYGEGRFLVCELPLVEQLATSPAAQRVLADLLLYAQSRTSGPLSEPSEERAARREQELAAFAAWGQR